MTSSWRLFIHAPIVVHRKFLLSGSTQNSRHLSPVIGSKPLYITNPTQTLTLEVHPAIEARRMSARSY